MLTNMPWPVPSLVKRVPSLLGRIVHPYPMVTFGPAESAPAHQEPLMIHCLAASICPAGKCLISADTKCDAKRSAMSPMEESVTTAILFTRL